jgi:hypothetical protein
MKSSTFIKLIACLLFVFGVPSCNNCGDDAVTYNYSLKGYKSLVVEENFQGNWNVKQDTNKVNIDVLRFNLKPILELKISSIKKWNTNFSLINTAYACSPGDITKIDKNLIDFKITSSSDFSEQFKAGSNLNSLFQTFESGYFNIDLLLKNNKNELILGSGLYTLKTRPEKELTHTFTFTVKFSDITYVFTSDKIKF